MRGGGGDGKDKEKNDRPRRADEAVLVWGKGMVRGEGGGTALCEPRTRRGVRAYSLNSRGETVGAAPPARRLTQGKRSWGGAGSGGGRF